MYWKKRFFCNIIQTDVGSDYLLEILFMTLLQQGIIGAVTKNKLPYVFIYTNDIGHSMTVCPNYSKTNHFPFFYCRQSISSCPLV